MGLPRARVQEMLDLVVIGNGRTVAQGTKADLIAEAGTVVRARDGVALVKRDGARRAGHDAPRRRQRTHRRLPRPGRRDRPRRVALVVGVLGTLVGSAVTGVDSVWNGTVTEFAHIVLGSVLGMLFGFMLGLLVRNSAGAIVTDFVHTLVLPPLLGVLAANQQWFADLQPWVDYGYAQMPLFNGNLSGEQWQQLAVSGGLWFVLPMVVGLLLVGRAEVK
jgi:hypothetical protein